MTRPVDRYHDRVGRFYDLIYDGDPYWKIYREITWKHMRPYLPRESGAAVLDAGGGTGYWAVKLARSGFQVTLADTSKGMLESARKKIRRSDLDEKIRLVLSDITRLDEFGDGCFDFVLAEGDPLSFCADAAKAVRSICRVLKSGGCCVASVDGKYAAMDHYLEKHDLDGLERFLRSGRTVWLGKREAERFPLRTFTPAELRSLFVGAGMEVKSLVGKTVLPLRKMKEQLKDRDMYVRLLHMETRLHREEALLGQAAHLAIAARRPPG